MKLLARSLRFNLWTRWLFLAAAVGLVASAPGRPAGPGWLLAAAAVYYLFVTVGYSVGMHRYFTHRSFHTGRGWEVVMLAAMVVSLGGLPFTWCRAHLLHHKHSDTVRDPYPVSTRGWRSVYLPYDPELTRERLALWMSDPLQRWANALYFVWVGLYLAVVGALFGWAGATWLWAAPVVFLHTFRQLFFHYSIHTWGYRNHETSDASRNNWVVALLTGGEGWHNNHHHAPARWSFRERWWELDPGAWFVRAIRRERPAFEVVRDELGEGGPPEGEGLRAADAG